MRTHPITCQLGPLIELLLQNALLLPVCYSQCSQPLMRAILKTLVREAKQQSLRQTFLPAQICTVVLPPPNWLIHSRAWRQNRFHRPLNSLSMIGNVRHGDNEEIFGSALS